MNYTAYFDFKDDGYGEIGPYELSSALLYERLCDDEFGPAINYCKIAFPFDSDFLSRRSGTTGDIYCRILEDGQPYFYGRIAPTDKFTSNGVALDDTADVSDFDIEVEDFSALFNRKITADDEIYWENHYVCNPTLPDESIFHRLIALCGLPENAVVVDEEELTILRAFAVDDGTVAEVLKSLLYQYGLVRRFNTGGQVMLYRWLIEEPVSEVDLDENIVMTGLECERVNRDADAAEVTWHSLKDKSDALIYMADLPFGDDNQRSGYPIQPGLLWPEEANVEETWWDYQDTSLSKILKGSLTVKNVDYSQMVLTKNHRLDVRVDDGVVPAFSPIFQNMRARVAYQHVLANARNIYYCNIYADVVYRAAENTVTKSNIENPKKTVPYEANYIHDETSATKLTCAIADGYTKGRWRYKFNSESKVPLGLIGKLKDPYSGMTVTVLVIERIHDTDDELYQYKAISIGGVVIASIAKRRVPLPEPTSADPEPYPSPKQPLSTGILAHYSFDDADVSGSVIIDNSGAGHHATRSGGSIVPGSRGKGLAMDETGKMDADYGEQDLSAGWVTLKTVTIVSTNPVHAAFSSTLHIQLIMPDGVIRDYVISGLVVNTQYPAGVVHNGRAAEIWVDGEIYGSYVCGPESIASVVMRLEPHADIAASVITTIDEMVDAARPFGAAEVIGYAAIGMEKKFGWADYLNKLAAEGAITPQDKTAIDLWFSEISGSYETLRDAAIAVEVPITDLDTTYEAITSYLYSSPGILVESTWADPIYIMVADWAQIKSAFASVVTAVTTEISEAQAAAAAAQAVKTIAPVFKGRVAYDDLSVTAGNEYDTIMAYSAAIAECGIYRREAGSWVDKTTPTAEMVTAAWFDILWALNNGFPDSGTDSEKLQAYIGSGTRFSTMQAYNVILANMIKTVNGFFENIVVSGRATLSELVLAGVTAGNNVVHYHQEILASSSIYSYDEAWRYTPPVSGVIRISGHYWAYQAGFVYLGIGHSDSTLVYETSGSAPPLQALQFSYDATVEENVSISIFIKKADDGSLAVRLNEIYVKIAENPGILRFISPPEILL